MNQQQKPPPRPPLVGIETQHDLHGINCYYPKAEIARDMNGELWVRTKYSVPLSGTIDLEVYDRGFYRPAEKHQIVRVWPVENYYEYACIPIGPPKSFYT